MRRLYALHKQHIINSATTQLPEMPTTASPQEHSPLLPVYVEPNYGRGNGEGGEDREDDEEGGRTATQVRVGELLENKKTHRFLLALVSHHQHPTYPIS